MNSFNIEIKVIPLALSGLGRSWSISASALGWAVDKPLTITTDEKDLSSVEILFRAQQAIADLFARLIDEAKNEALQKT